MTFPRWPTRTRTPIIIGHNGSVTASLPSGSFPSRRSRVTASWNHVLGTRNREAALMHCSREPTKTPLQEEKKESTSDSVSLAPAVNNKHEANGQHELQTDAEELDLDKLPTGFIETEGVRGMPHRWILTIVMGIAFVICNMDKVNMSVAVIPMAKDLGWNATGRGIVQSSFFWGYTLTQIPAGWLSTRIGGEKVLLAGVFLWSLGTLVAPAAARTGFNALCISRVAVGLGEGLAPSAATSVLSKQVPASERSRAVSTVFGGLDLGSSVGLILCGPLIRLYGWPCVFHLFAVFGFCWCLVWPLLRPSLRDSAIWRSKSTRQKLKYYDDVRLAKKVPWDLIIQSTAVWAIIAAHFCYNWGYYTLLAWLPSYFEMALDLNVQNSSFLTVIPYMAMTLMTPLVLLPILCLASFLKGRYLCTKVGPSADAFVERGMSLTTVRKLCQGISFLGPALCMAGCAFFTPQSIAHTGPVTVPLIVALLTAAFALGAWARAGLYCNHQDISPRFASALLGLSNTAGAVPGILGVWSAGYLFDRFGNWAIALFYPIILAQLSGLVIYSLFANSEPQKWS